MVNSLTPVPSATRAFISSPKVISKIKKYSKRQPLTWLPSRLKTYPRICATDPEKKQLMPKFYPGACWGGTALKVGSFREINSIKNEERAIKIATVADAYLLANRQLAINIFITVTKIICFVDMPILLPLVAPPLEGAIDARKTKKLMKKILKENQVDLKKLEKVDFSKMSLAIPIFEAGKITPMRNGLGTVALPKNTNKTRKHLNELLPENDRLKLAEILNDKTNYKRSTLKQLDSTHGGVLTEEGWRKVLRLIVAPENSADLRRFIWIS